MGLIKALAGAAGGVMADQWKEYFYCDSIDGGVLVVKGEKKTSDKRSSNKKASDNIISDGSVIAVNEGQCMMIVEQGKVVDVCAEPGEYVYDTSTEPSIFCGDLEDAVSMSFETLGKRFTFGGDTAKDQRVYYFNMKEIMGNKYGTPSPIPFRVVDQNIGLDIDSAIRCHGEYSYRIVNPILFYTNVCGNVENKYDKSNLDSMLKSELLTALQPAFAKISDQGIRYSSLPAHTTELAQVLNQVLSEKWHNTRGIAIASFGVNSVKASEEDEKMIKELQKSAIMRDPSMAAASIVGAQADAMRNAASNEGGAMNGFVGMGMAQQAGGINAQELYNMGQQKQPQSAQGTAGTPQSKGWACSCGEVNQGNFCPSCGMKRPQGAPLYKCDKCGWEPEDPTNPPKFCPDCGDIFDEKDQR